MGARTRRAAVSMVGVCAWALAASGARAEPLIGGSVDVAQPGTSDDSARIGASVYGLRVDGDWLTLGGELSGSVGGFTGGYGCGTRAPSGDAVPAIAVFCLEPSLSAHALVGRRIPLAARSMLRLEVGAGATARFLFPGDSGTAQRSVFGSGLARATLLVRTGDEFLGGRWWFGAQAQQRVVGVANPESTTSLGLVLEAVVVD